MKKISVELYVTEEQEKRIQRMIPELNAYGSASNLRCEDWTEKSVLELLISCCSLSDSLDQQLSKFETTLGI